MVDSRKLAADAVVLAGGEGRRLGRRKEGIALGGKSLLVRHLERWLPLFERVRVSARGPLAVPLPAEVELVVDPPGARSLIDVLPPLIDRIGRPFWLVAVDLPLVPLEIPRALLAAHVPGRCVFPEHARGLEMLCGLYDPACRDTIEGLIARDDRALHRIAEETGATRLRHPEDFPPLSGLAGRLGPFFNLNTPEDLATLEAAFAAEDPP